MPSFLEETIIMSVLRKRSIHSQTMKMLHGGKVRGRRVNLPRDKLLLKMLNVHEQNFSLGVKIL